MKAKAQTYKAIFQTVYKPELEFHGRLDRSTPLTDYFPDWEKDSMSLVLKDYQKHHSLSIKFDSITYETDDYKKSELERVAGLLLEDYAKYHTSVPVRYGLRQWYLVDVNPISFEELVEIVNLKVLSSDFLEIAGNPIDNTIVIDVRIRDLVTCKIYVGAMKRSEVEGYLKMNTKLHFYKSDANRLEEIIKVLQHRPAVSLYMDIDIISKEQNSNPVEFLNDSIEQSNKLTRNLIDYVFKDKLK